MCGYEDTVVAPEVELVALLATLPTSNGVPHITQLAPELAIDDPTVKSPRHETALRGSAAATEKDVNEACCVDVDRTVLVAIPISRPI